jgi:hypothetical protein
MKTPTALPLPSQLARRANRPLPPRDELSPPSANLHALRPARCGHDFLVPNPRPDLTLDPNMLRMLEAG